MYKTAELSELVSSNLPLLRICTSYLIGPAAVKVLLDVKDLRLAEAIAEIALNVAGGHLTESAEVVARRLPRMRYGRRQYILKHWRDVCQILKELLTNLQDDDADNEASAV